MSTDNFFVVEMPLNHQGNGPEMDPTKVVKTKYLVWDVLMLPVTEFDTPEESQRVAEDLNIYWNATILR